MYCDKLCFTISGYDVVNVENGSKNMQDVVRTSVWILTIYQYIQPLYAGLLITNANVIIYTVYIT